MQLPLVPANESATIIAAAAILATIGWVYTARRARTRKQHTINIILEGNFDLEMRNAHAELIPIFRGEDVFPAVGSDRHKEIQPKLRFVLNHFEFIAAGIRRGDMDERLVMDAQRGTILTAFEKSEPHILWVRSNRRNQSVYEHLEWLHKRWEKSPPGKCRSAAEWCKGSPF